MANKKAKDRVTKKARKLVEKLIDDCLETGASDMCHDGVDSATARNLFNYIASLESESRLLERVRKANIPPGYKQSN